VSRCVNCINCARATGPTCAAHRTISQEFTTLGQLQVAHPRDNSTRTTCMAIVPHIRRAPQQSRALAFIPELEDRAQIHHRTRHARCRKPPCTRHQGGFAEIQPYHQADGVDRAMAAKRHHGRQDLLHLHRADRSADTRTRRVGHSCHAHRCGGVGHRSDDRRVARSPGGPARRGCTARQRYDGVTACPAQAMFRLAIR